MMLNSDFILPEYQDDCFSNIPNTVLSLFGIKTKRPTISRRHFKKYINQRYKNIIVFLIDAFGFYQWKKYGNQFALFKQIDEKKFLTPITSVFPSTTAAALNTIHSCLTPAEHGLFEFTLYIKEIDKTIKTLRFHEIENKKQDSLLDEKVTPKILFNFKTIYQLLKKHDINSFSFANKEYANSVYSQTSRKDSITISFTNFSDLVVKLKEQLVKSKGKNYFFVYWDKLDTLGHEYGPHHNACKVELAKISYLFLKEFVEKVNKKTKKQTLLIIIADHGQITVNPKQTFYLNKDEFLKNSLQKDKKGKIILPTGSPRNVFLHIREVKLENIYKYLKEKLKDKAEVIKTNEAIALGLFGKNKIESKFKNRLGNLIVLPYKNYTIWREYKGEKFEYLGHHGGLSKEEMIIPFSICNLNEI